MKRWCILLAAALAFGCSSSDSDNPEVLSCGNLEVAEGDIAIVYTNDVHTEAGGYAAVAGFADCVAEITDNITLVDAGDFSQGGPLGTYSQGDDIMDIMNMVGYNIVAVGNHEFDYGINKALELDDNLDATVVSANFVSLGDDQPIFEAYTIKTYGTTKVAFVGITTPETLSKSSPAYFQNENDEWIYAFKQGADGAELYEAVQAAVDAARAEVGADGYVIALGHLGIDPASAPWTSVEVIASTRGIDAFIDGHSHSTVETTVDNLDGDEVPLTQTGTKLAGIGLLRISPDSTISVGLLSDFDEVNADVDAFVDDIMGEGSDYANYLATPVGNTSVDLVVNDPDGSRIIRSRETNLGDLTADAYRYVLGNGNGGPADVGFVNGGGIRTNIAQGEITFGEVIAVHPFSNYGVVVEATGQQILDALEMSVRFMPTGENGGYLQVSGLKFNVDTGIPSSVTTDSSGAFVSVDGARRVSGVMIGVEWNGSALTAGTSINPNATYTVASHNFMLLDGGDGLNMFRDCDVVDLGGSDILDNEILIKYIDEELNGAVGADYSNPLGQGRINILP